MKNFIFDAPAAYARSLAKTMLLLPPRIPPASWIYKILLSHVTAGINSAPVTASAGILPYLGKRN
ncbi:hypothetical protein [uncultured Campylobacter sp.]|uniref:hypothetical protein n=1 Tax=uncultured Campylobacter sp. TaxID=218934 RepID=UPI002636485B|nr:hypothetical protein [uncultured Campylobacter sp.]